MSRFHLFQCFAGWLLLMAAVCLPGMALGGPAVKVGVYNIHGGVGSDGNTGLARIARVLKSAAPDVIGLNEVNRYWIGDNHDEVIRDHLGDEWTTVFGKTLTKIPRDYGNAILTRLPIVSSQSWLLSTYPSQERRGLLRVTVQVGDERLHVFCTHMGLNADMRQIHAQEILDIMAEFTDAPRILMGDFNEMRSGTSMEMFAAQYKDCWELYGLSGGGGTFSAVNPTRRIDLIFLGQDLVATDCNVGMDPDARVASDHLPVFANVVMPGEDDSIVNNITLNVNGVQRLQMSDTVPDNPNAYTQGSVVLVTSGDTGPAEVVADNLGVDRLQTIYSENFNTTPIGSVPADWDFLYATAGEGHAAGVSMVEGERFWRQRSEGYVKYHYAPTPYPTWKDYQVSARIKTVSTGGGAWRMLAYNYPATDTAYETYKIEVRHDAGSLPRLRIMKGAAQLAATNLPDHDADVYDWNVYGLQVREVRLANGSRVNRIEAFVNGRQVAWANDPVPAVVDPNAYSQGSVVLTTVGHTAGWCEIYVDDVVVREWTGAFAEDFDGVVSADWKWLYQSPGEDAVGEVVPGLNGNGWRQRSDKYVKYHVAPTPYPDWRDVSYSLDVKTVGFGGAGKWRMNGYNYPATNTAYDTYKLEVNAGGGTPKLRLMKSGSMIHEITFASMGLNVSNWQDYEINIQSFVPATRIIEKGSHSGVGDWLEYN